MIDQSEGVAGEDVLGIESGVVRLGAVAVGAVVRHDHAQALSRDRLGMAEADPVGEGVRDQAVEQDDGSSVRLAHLVPGDLLPVWGSEMMDRRVSNHNRHPELVSGSMVPPGAASNRLARAPGRHGC